MSKESKFLSLVLRHQPEAIGISLDKNGWTNVSGLIKGMQIRFPSFNQRKLDEVVESDDKKRFEYSNESKVAIRACQGHSVKIDLGLESVSPPQKLFHGTVWTSWESISKSSLNSGNRTLVQLSEDIRTATEVGRRHGRNVVILEVDCTAMEKDGFQFFKSNNNVWLTKEIPAKYLTVAIDSRKGMD
jgi:putative RNA 2'-phosphotransferase